MPRLSARARCEARRLGRRRFARPTSTARTLVETRVAVRCDVARCPQRARSAAASETCGLHALQSPALAALTHVVRVDAAHTQIVVRRAVFVARQRASAHAWELCTVLTPPRNCARPQRSHGNRTRRGSEQPNARRARRRVGRRRAARRERGRRGRRRRVATNRNPARPDPADLRAGHPVRNRAERGLPARADSREADARHRRPVARSRPRSPGRRQGRDERLGRRAAAASGRQGRVALRRGRDVPRVFRTGRLPRLRGFMRGGSRARRGHVAHADWPAVVDASFGDGRSAGTGHGAAGGVGPRGERRRAADGRRGGLEAGRARGVVDSVDFRGARDLGHVLRDARRRVRQGRVAGGGFALRRVRPPASESPVSASQKPTASRRESRPGRLSRRWNARARRPSC